MKKVLIVANIDPFKYYWWVEFVCKSIAEEIKEFYEVIIVCRWNKNDSYQNNWMNIFSYKIFWFPLIWDFQYAVKINKLIDYIKPDLIIDNGSLSFLSSNKWVKIISIAHGTNYYNYKTRKINLKTIYRLLWSFIQKQYLKKVLNIISVADKVKEELMDDFYKIPDKKIKVINNWTYINIDRDLQNKIINKEFSYKWIFISNNHKIKGLDVVERISIKFEKITFYICWSEYDTKIKNMKYLWKLNHDNLREKMIESDFFIFPSIYEWQSLAVLDALACGLPVILSKASDPWIIENKKNWYIIHDSEVESYKKAIEDLYNSKDKIKEIRKNNIELMKNYTWRIQWKKYLDFINEILWK